MYCYTTRMKITILGSGAWEGVPAPFCKCDVCAIAIKLPFDKNNRMRPQLLVENDDERFLVEISPDIRLQSTRFGLPPVKDFLVSHWHFDHMYGINELHQYSKEVTNGLNIYCSAGTNAILDTDEFSYIPQSIHIMKPLEPFELAGIKITPLPVYHMRSEDEAIAEDKLANTFGFLFEHSGKKVAYLADYYRVPQSVQDKIRGIDAVICEGTYLLTDDFKSHKPNHMHGQDIVDFANSTYAKKIYYHSVSHLTHKKHDELQEMLSEGQTLAFDGMILEF